MVTEATRFNLAEDVTFQSVGGGCEQTVILSLATGILYTCNGVTASFLSAIDGERGFGEVIESMLQQYDVSRDQLREDLAALSDKLVTEKLIVAES